MAKESFNWQTLSVGYNWRANELNNKITSAWWTGDKLLEMKQALIDLSKLYDDIEWDEYMENEADQDWINQNNIAAKLEVIEKHLNTIDWEEGNLKRTVQLYLNDLKGDLQSKRKFDLDSRTDDDTGINAWLPEEETIRNLFK